MLRLRRLLRGPLSGDFGRDGQRQGRLHRQNRRRHRDRHGRGLPHEHRRLPTPPAKRGAHHAPGGDFGANLTYQPAAQARAGPCLRCGLVHPDMTTYAQPEHHDFLAASAQALADPPLQAALTRLTDTLMAGNRRGYATLTQSSELRDHAKRIKEHTLANLDKYLEQLEVSVQKL